MQPLRVVLGFYRRNMVHCLITCSQFNNRSRILIKARAGRNFSSVLFFSGMLGKKNTHGIMGDGCAFPHSFHIWHNASCVKMLYERENWRAYTSKTHHCFHRTFTTSGVVSNVKWTGECVSMGRWRWWMPLRRVSRGGCMPHHGSLLFCQH